MKTITHSFALVILAYALISCEDLAEPQVADPTENMTHDQLMEHVEYLADDELRGREPGTEGEDMAIDYIINQFEEIGIEPGMPDGSFTQSVPLVGQNTTSAELTFQQNNQPIGDYEYFDDFMSWPARDQEEVNIRDAELVYVGYGIHAPEEDWDDFKDVDVSGKILVVKNFNPVTYEDRFEGGERLYYGRWNYKFEQAIEEGALGALIIHTDETAGYGWDVVANSWNREMPELDVTYDHDMELEGWLTQSTSEDLFESAGYDFDEMLEMAEDPNFEPVDLEGITLNADIEAEYSTNEGRNVVGMLPGNDPDVGDEALIFSAHHDHLGVGEPVEGDSIYNGAWDNASGVSSTIEMARSFKQVEDQINRSVYFITVTAEEGGILGSEYFANNLPIPAGSVTANFNLDSVNIFGRTRDLEIVGLNRSDIDDYLHDSAEELEREIIPDQNPEQGLFYRSDHISFARVGIPAIFPKHGTDWLDHDDDFTETVNERTDKIYHTVHDRVHDWWDMSGAAQDNILLFDAAFDIINAGEKMQWLPGDEFEQARMDALEEVEI